MGKVLSIMPVSNQDYEMCEPVFESIKEMRPGSQATLNLSGYHDLPSMKREITCQKL